MLLKLDEVPTIVETMLERLSLIEKSELDVSRELEYWETANLEQSFRLQKPALKIQIAKARVYYQKLKERL